MGRFDVAVVGLGSLGSGAAYQAAIKGAKVIGFEQFELGHVRGALHDTSRIIRTSYGSPEFVALARSAYKDRADMEKRSGLQLVTITGGVVFLPRGRPTPSSDFIESLTANSVPYELLDSKEVNQRWPGFKIADGIDAAYTADTGIVHDSNGQSDSGWPWRGHRNLRAHSLRAGKVILAADAWINKLLGPLGCEIPMMTTMQEQVTYFKPSDPLRFDPKNFPVWIWGGETWYYGFPSYREPTIKAGQDTQRNVMHSDHRTFVHSPELLKKLAGFMDSIIPNHALELRTVTCQYAITPDRQFITGPFEKYPDNILALGNGHAFKFAPAIGPVVAELAIDGETSDDISKFAVPCPSGSSKL